MFCKPVLDFMKSDEFLKGNVRFSLNGNPLEIQFSVPAKPVKLQRMLPIFQQMTNTFVEANVTAVKKSDEEVSCKKGCGACCRQPVPVAEIEAYKLAEIVEDLPEPRRSKIKKRFEAAFRHFRETGWIEKLLNCENDEQLKEIALEYFYEGIPCPFLENESCSIHRQRPLACREYLVTSPAENCANPSAATVDMIPQPVKLSNALRKLGQSRKIGNINFIPLVLSLDWAHNNSYDFSKKSGEEWMGEFLRNVTGKEIPKKD